MSIAVEEFHPSSAATLAPDAEPGHAAQRVFGFIAVRLSLPDGPQPPDRQAIAARPRWLQLPPSGIGYLQAAAGQAPRVLPGPPDSAAAAIALEPVFHQGHAYLVMKRPSLAVRVNGAPAPRMAVLRPGDQVQIQAADDWLLTVSLYVRAYRGPQLDEHLGLKCPYCRSPFTADLPVQVYGCPHCGAVLHCQGEEAPADDRLECAKLCSQCPRCSMPIVLKPEGEFSHVPQL